MPIKSINDDLIDSCKALTRGSGNIPFPSYGSGWGASQIFQSEQAWDSWIDGQYGFSSAANLEKYRQKIGDLSKNSLIMAAVRFLGDSLTQASLQVKQKTGGKGGKKGDSEVVEDHPAVALWNTPNPCYSGSTLKRGIAFSLVIASETFIIQFMNDARTKVMELWWEPHWTIRPIWPVDGSEFISAYEVNRNGQWYQIPKDMVLHIRDGINPYNQRRGLSGNDSILRELFGDEQAADYYATLMGGSGIPGLAISIDKDIGKGFDQKTMDALEKRVIDKTSGAKRGQPLIFKGGRPYKIGLNPRELDLRETRYTAEDRFCAIQGIPAVVLELGTGHEHSIYNNVTVAMERAWRSYVCPKLTMIEEELTVQFLSHFEDEGSGKYCEHDLSKVPALQEDQDAKAKRLRGLWKDGIIMRQEARSGMGYSESEEGNEEVDKVFYVSSGTQLLKPGEVAAPQPDPPPGLGPEGISPGVAIPTGRQTPLLSASKKLLGPAKSLELSQAIQDLLPSGSLNPKAEWKDFPQHWNSLNIPRTSMPQVLSEHRGALVQFLRGRGITHKKEDVAPTLLQPSQKEYRPDKVEKAKDWEGTQRPILVSSDNHVVDGHHQWMAAVEDKPTVKIPIIKLDSPILPLLLEVARFPSSGVKDENDEEKFWKGMPNGKYEISMSDVQKTIAALKRNRYNAAAEMMTAKTVKKSNGNEASQD